MKMVKFEMGDLSTVFPFKLNLISKEEVQVRDNALDAGRTACNRALERKLGKGMYHFTVRTYPHHVLRENPLAAGAGADRMSTGMSHSFGKIIGTAARLRKGQAIMTAEVQKEGIATAKEALRKASAKMPCKCIIEVVENK